MLITRLSKARKKQQINKVKGTALERLIMFTLSKSHYNTRILSESALSVIDRKLGKTSKNYFYVSKDFVFNNVKYKKNFDLFERGFVKGLIKIKSKGKSKGVFREFNFYNYNESIGFLLKQGFLKNTNFSVMKKIDVLEERNGKLFVYECKNKEKSALNEKDLLDAILYALLLRKAGFYLGAFSFIVNGRIPYSIEKQFYMLKQRYKLPLYIYTFDNWLFNFYKKHNKAIQSVNVNTYNRPYYYNIVFGHKYLKNVILNF